MECALWFWVHGSIHYELCDDEAEAARSAVGMTEYETGSPAGVQFADGTYIDREDWDAYKAEERRNSDEIMQRLRAEDAKPKPATRKIRPPFDDREIFVLVEAPDWLGRPSG